MMLFQHRESHLPVVIRSPPVSLLLSPACCSNNISLCATHMLTTSSPFFTPSFGSSSVTSVLKSSLVQSFTPIWRQPDRNWSFCFPDLRQPDQDRTRLVHVGPHISCNRLATGPHQDQSQTSIELMVYVKFRPLLMHKCESPHFCAGIGSFLCILYIIYKICII